MSLVTVGHKGDCRPKHGAQHKAQRAERAERAGHEVLAALCETNVHRRIGGWVGAQYSHRCILSGCSCGETSFVSKGGVPSSTTIPWLWGLSCNSKRGDKVMEVEMMKMEKMEYHVGGTIHWICGPFLWPPAFQRDFEQF